MNTSAPIIQQHELTGKCNNNCGFCYNPERCWKLTSLPRQEDMERNLAIAKLSVAKGVMAICLTGGEPLIMGEHFFDVLDIYRQAGCYTSINSNGRLITPEIAQRLQINSALISIHGTKDLHNEMVGDANAFDETIAGIKNLLAANVHVMPNFVATAKNLHGLKATADFLKTLGITAMTVTPFLPSWAAPNHDQFLLQQEHYRYYFQLLEEIDLKVDSTLPIPPCVLIKFFPNDYQRYLKVLSPRVCMAGKSFGVISPDGFFRSCIQAPYFPEYGGTVLRDYEQSWQNANTWADSKMLPKECLDCKALAICGGGCRTSCLWENSGSPNGKTMYMGLPLTEKEAKPFIDRINLPPKRIPSLYKWNKQLKFRIEKDGIIVFNPQNQSFCLLNNAFKGYLTGTLIVLDLHTALVLLSMDAMHQAPEQESNIRIVPEEAKAITADHLLPRLAKDLPEDIWAKQLRADTGERLFF